MAKTRRARASKVGATVCVVAATLLAFACGGKSSSDAAASSIAASSSGGVYTADGVTLDIPAGALATDTEITITSDTNGPPGAAVDGLVYHFAPEGLHFSVPITVTLPGSNTSELAYWTNDGSETTYAPQPTVYTAAGARFQATHFSSGYVGTAATTDSDAGAVDATVTDASVSDVSVSDASTSDSSISDASVSDSEVSDATDADVSEAAPPASAPFNDEFIANLNILDAVFDGAGSIIIGGSYHSSSIDFGNGQTLPAPPNATYGFLAKFDLTGKCAWAVPLIGPEGPAGGTSVLSLAATPNHEIVFLAETYSASVQLDQAAVTTNGNVGVLGRVNANGLQVFLKTYGPESDSFAMLSAAVDTAGNIVFSFRYDYGTGSTALIFDGISATGSLPKDATAVGVVYLSGAGVAEWVKTFPPIVNDAGIPGSANGGAISFDRTGNIIVGGRFSNTIEMQEGDGTSHELTSKGGHDGWVAKLEPTMGHTMWSTQIGGVSPDGVTALGVDSTGSVIVAFDFETTFTLGTTLMSSYADAYGGDAGDPNPENVGIARYDTNGVLSTAKAFPGPAWPSQLTIDSSDAIILAGQEAETLTFGGLPATAGSEGDGGLWEYNYAFVVKLSPSFTVVSANGLKNDGIRTIIQSVAVDESENLLYATLYASFGLLSP